MWDLRQVNNSEFFTYVGIWFLNILWWYELRIYKWVRKRCKDKSIIFVLKQTVGNLNYNLESHRYSVCPKVSDLLGEETAHCAKCSHLSTMYI